MKRKRHGMMRFSLLMVVAMFLSGCMNVATTGAQAIYNRRSLEKSWKDQSITLKANQALYNREVLLSGEVPYAWQKMRAEQIVKNIPDVKEVYNSIIIAGASSPLTRLSDTWLTAKIKSKLIVSEDLDATQIKVVTENGTVYLMGIVLPEEANAAFDIANETEGVQKVVKLFSYIKITKEV
jgi:osmotically-inducible protein OsmY